MTKGPFIFKRVWVKECLKLMHTNMCGPFNVQASREYKYFITFTDDYSEYGYVYLRKFVVVDKFKEFKAELENQLGKRL